MSLFKLIYPNILPNVVKMQQFIKRALEREVKPHKTANDSIILRAEGHPVQYDAGPRYELRLQRGSG